MFTTVYLIDTMNPGEFDYYDNRGERFRDYEGDAMQESHWPADSANDVKDEDDYYLEDSLEEGEYDTREDLGWDGGYKD